MTAHTISSLAKAGVLLFGDGYRTRRDELASSGFRIIRVADINTGSIDFSSPDFVSEKLEHLIGKKRVEEGDIVLTTKGTVGRVALIPVLGERAVYSPQVCYFRVQDKTLINPRWLYYWLQSAQFWKQARDRMHNTDMAAYINLTDIASLQVSVPDLSKQDEVVDILGALDDKIFSNSAQCAILDSLARAIAKLAYHESPLVPIDRLASVFMGSSPRGEDLNEQRAGIPFFQGVRDFSRRRPRPRVWTESPVRTALKNDVLLSVRAPVGRINLSPGSVAIGRGIAAIRSKHGAPYALFHALHDAESSWSAYNSVGTVFGSVNRERIEATLVPTLGADGDVRLDRELADIERCLLALEGENEELVKLRDVLLPVAITGGLPAVEPRDAIRKAI
ncbi:hypothetical protein C5B94_08055 [Clavibacter michiganensis]|uniref:restriction endonuclease subunit S n=1 Tax=Clavibacter michiganensis TaxID=28447 RepID=UPI000CE736D4|nr:restriction endonuclease subunit S [Clavibacter michiganensis]PPF54299.1 hypothetical protein C5B94_08055 [Clavibacter michiganensis]